jgi:non-specific serine/threonine protein kinase
VLHLGAVETAAPLPPGLSFWRDLGRLFVTRLCAVPNLEADWSSAVPELPGAEIEALAAAAPPVPGAEYVSAGALAACWFDLLAAFRSEVAAAGEGGVRAWLAARDPAWSLVGRVCFHLAENRNDEAHPFAFLATYADKVGAGGRPRHRPLGQALREYAGERDREALLRLLLPVRTAADRLDWVRELADSGAVYHPLAWSPAEAHRFLQDVAELEASGLAVRIPDWWSARAPARPRVQVTIGGDAANVLNLGNLLSFSVETSLDGEPLDPEEWETLLESAGGLARLRGRWVEVDPERLREVLDQWKKLQRAAGRDGIPLSRALRLLAGTSIEARDGPAADDGEAADWSVVTAGPGLARALEALRNPDRLDVADPGDALRATLRPYQQVGLRWLHHVAGLGLGGCLADDMGLGKTLQVIALLLLLRRAAPERPPSLIVVPASLIANWCAEVERFAPSLRLFVAHASVTPPDEVKAPPKKTLERVDAVLTTYGALLRLEWPFEREWELAVLDEAQAIKNPGARQTRAAKRLRARARFALTGTPVENRLGDLWSLFDFLCPGLLGSSEAFARFAKRLAGSPGGYAPLRELVRPYVLRRLKTDKAIIADLPDKTEVKAFCPLAPPQAAQYQRAVDDLADAVERLDGMQRRGLILATLMRLKQICNHPSQFTGDGAYRPDDSGKFRRLREIAEEIAARQQKALVFTQFREITEPLAEFLHPVFGRPGLVLHGNTPVRRRKDIVADFQREDGPPFLVLSLKAGGTGLNLTAAAHVVHFDRWWNPAVENQATDRAFRIGQTRNVLVHKFVCRGTVEERIDALIESKKALADEVVSAGAEALLTELPTADLLRLVRLDLRAASAD